MAKRIPEVRRQASERGRELEFAGMAYVVFGADDRTVERAERELLRYYGTLRRPFEEMVHRGDRDALEAQLGEYRQSLAEELLPRLTGTGGR
jgi:hypothetical protein